MSGDPTGDHKRREVSQPVAPGLAAPGPAAPGLAARRGERAPAIAAGLLATLIAATGTQAAPQIEGARLEPVAYSDLAGWAGDDHVAAFATFLKSCATRRNPPVETGPASTPTLRAGLDRACAAADRVVAALGGSAPSPVVARLFFEANFRPFRVLPGGTGAGFFTGYYEPELDGAPAKDATHTVPIHARPPDLVMQAGPAANSGPAGRRVPGMVELEPYYDRAAIEDGALDGRGLELAWLKDPIDLFFMQIQGSGRVRLPDGRVLRLNYDGYNGHRYVPVGRFLIERGIVPREEMSMDRIRQVMEADPALGKALRRENPSYVFFKVLDLPADAGAMGAQGVPLTAGRSIAVDRKLHTYGSPVFVEAELPLDAPPAALAPFQRLMIAQDTGSAIIGPARADLYFGAGQEMGALAGRIRHPGRFTLLVPRSFDAAAGSEAARP